MRVTSFSTQNMVANMSNQQSKLYEIYNKINLNQKYTDISFKDGDFLVFGPETRGLPEDLLAKKAEYALTIPMNDGQRSLNLSNSVAIVVYEALRQLGV